MVERKTEQAFLCLCLRGFWHPPSVDEALALAARESFDWAAVLRAAHMEKLSPLLYCLLRDRQNLPPAVGEALGESYYPWARSISLIMHELERTLSALAERSVPVLLLKGAALVDTVYRNVGPRPMGDVDLLVPREQARAAEGILTSLGYGMVTADPWPGFSWRYRNSVSYGRRTDEDAPFYVGLHTQLFDVPFYQRIPVGDWFGRAWAVEGAVHGARMPAPEDHLVYLCGHLTLHHGRERGLLRTLDIALLIRWAGESLDWDQVVKRAVDWRLVIPLQRAVADLQDMWPDVVPPGAAAEVAGLRAQSSERRVCDWVAKRRTPASDTLLALATLPGITRRVRFLLEMAIPSPAYMRQRYCPERPALWPLTYVSRVVWAFRHLLRRSR